MVDSLAGPLDKGKKKNYPDRKGELTLRLFVDDKILCRENPKEFAS